MNQRAISDKFPVFIVSVYLLLVGAWLLLSGRIKSSALAKILRSSLRPRYFATLDVLAQEQGHCYKALLPPELLSDLESASRLRVYEDGFELGPAHSAHDEVRRLGSGRFSHWGADLYFSASDNSDPRSNGRRYEVRETLS